MFLKFQIFISLLAATASRAIPAAPQLPALVPSVAPFSLNVTDLERSAGVGLTAPTILFCGAADCASECYRHSLEDRPFDQCQIQFLPRAYNSVGISNPDGRVLPYTVWVGFTTKTCPDGLLMIPKTNACYNLTPSGNGFERKSGATA